LSDPFYLQPAAQTERSPITVTQIETVEEVPLAVGVHQIHNDADPVLDERSTQHADRLRTRGGAELKQAQVASRRLDEPD
jgi:hypothetical protein